MADILDMVAETAYMSHHAQYIDYQEHSFDLHTNLSHNKTNNLVLDRLIVKGILWIPLETGAAMWIDLILTQLGSLRHNLVCKHFL